jgi:hypothetical protein
MWPGQADVARLGLQKNCSGGWWFSDRRLNIIEHGEAVMLLELLLVLQLKGWRSPG